MRALTGLGGVAIGLILVAGCGDDSSTEPPGEPVDSGADVAGAGEVEPEPDEPIESSSTVTTVDDDDQEPPSTSAIPDGPDPPPVDDGPPSPVTTIEAPPGYEGLCDLAVAMKPLTSELEELDENADVDEVVDLFGVILTLMRESLPDLPPGQIGDDTALVAEGVDQIVAALSEYEGTFSDAVDAAAEDERLAILFEDDTIYDQASERWDEVVLESCGISV